jgi:predicted nucleotidyltransferase
MPSEGAGAQEASAIIKRIHYPWITAKMKPSVALQAHRDMIRLVVERHGACNPRVFGSVLHGVDDETSDLDLLVDPIEGKTTLLSLVRIKREIESLTGISTDVLTPLSLHERFRQVVLAEAKPI